jgi:hypothetical protein
MCSDQRSQKFVFTALSFVIHIRAGCAKISTVVVTSERDRRM